MALRKNTHLEDRCLVHTWTDGKTGFEATVRRQDWMWIVTIGEESTTVSVYLRAVDLVMDAWRLTKDAARTMTEMGH